MLTSHKLDAWVLPRNVNFVPSDEAIESIFARWRSEAILSPQGYGAGPSANLVFEGGFEQVVVVKSDSVRFVANQQGGFRVFCEGRNVTSLFVRAMADWRSGAKGRVLHSTWGETYPLETLDFRPSAGFYQFAFEFRDIGRVGLGEGVADAIRSLMGEFHIVYRRVG